MQAVEQAVKTAILEEFREIDRLGGVLAAVEHRYQRSQIQAAAHRYEQQIADGVRPIIGLNRYRAERGSPADMESGAHAHRQEAACRWSGCGRSKSDMPAAVARLWIDTDAQ